ncbi:GNAT family N-acetyltransferase [Rossellomorea aquimaris]|uniref:GNAT family N-acetyltransferase n=1 Tax=Rossellomorea aquimaris TaxID=189382 RepID=UPI0007D08F5B|nr:GNAT family N-acetyltransferase [Rossellomorea aquimaris]
MEFKIIEALNIDQIKQLTEMFQLEWWTKGRKFEEVQCMIDHSDVIVAFVKDKELIAFARVLTDFVYKAFIFDVMVKPSYRDADLGKKLMYLMINHSKLVNVQHFELYCRPEMKPFYEKWGFTNDLGELCFMRRG